MLGQRQCNTMHDVISVLRESKLESNFGDVSLRLGYPAPNGVTMDEPGRTRAAAVGTVSQTHT